MAEYWGLDIADPLASGLVLGCMFDQPNLTDQILNLASPFTLTSEGTPTRPTVEGKLAYQPATDASSNDTRLEFDDQWLTHQAATNPLTIMTRFSTDFAPPFSTTPGIGQIGRQSGAGGIFLYLTDAGNIAVGATSWNTSIETTYTVTQDTLYRVITRYGVITSGIEVDLHVDGATIGSRGTGSTANDERCEIGTIFRYQFGLCLPGPITDYFIWDRVLSDQEVADLFADPYRFLIPPDTGVAPPQNAIMHGINF